MFPKTPLLCGSKGAVMGIYFSEISTFNFSATNCAI